LVLTVVVLGSLIAAGVLASGLPTHSPPHHANLALASTTIAPLHGYARSVTTTVDHAVDNLAKHHIAVPRRHQRSGPRHTGREGRPRSGHPHSSSGPPPVRAASQSATATSPSSTASSGSSSRTSATTPLSSSQAASSSAASQNQTAGPTGPGAVLGPGRCNC
jgi:hypothetical protein